MEEPFKIGEESGREFDTAIEKHAEQNALRHDAGLEGSSEQSMPSQEVTRRIREIRDGNVFALIKETERYIFIYDDESAAELFKTLGRFASDKELSFTWYDAAILSQRVRKLCEEEPR